MKFYKEMLQDERLLALLEKLTGYCDIDEADSSLQFKADSSREIARLHQDIRFLLQDKLKEARETEDEISAGYILLIGSEIKALLAGETMTATLAPLSALVQIEENVRRKVW